MFECHYLKNPTKEVEKPFQEASDKQLASKSNWVNLEDSRTKITWINNITAMNAHQKIQSEESVIIARNVKITICAKTVLFVGCILIIKCRSICHLKDQITRLSWLKMKESLWFGNRSNFQTDHDFYFINNCRFGSIYLLQYQSPIFS